MRQIGPYEVRRELARGGMGVVYEAWDPRGARRVAVKVVLVPGEDPRFAQEVEALRRLDHPGVVACLDAGREPGGRDFLVMEFVDGESLRGALSRRGPLPVSEAVGVARELCAALSYAHARGVWHRDLKPENVLVTRTGQLKLTDFGLGKVLASSRESLTKTGDLLGTPAYMAPEQATGDRQAMGPPTDVYGLGATLYALVTGAAPFAGPTALNVIHAVLTEDPAPPSARRPQVDPALEALVLRCMSKDPADRPRLDEVAAALAGWRDAPAARARGGRVARAGALALVVAVALGAALWQRPEGAGRPTPASAQDVGGPDAPVFERLLEEARALVLKDEFARAAPLYEQASELAPGHVKTWVNLAFARGMSGDDPGAVEACDAALALDPDSVPALALRGSVLLDQGAAAEAAADLDRARAVSPTASGCHLRAGTAWLQLEETERALEALSMAIALGHRVPEGLLLRAVAWHDLGHYELALKDANRGLAHGAGTAGDYEVRGTLHGKLGNAESAVDDFDQALRLDPTRTTAHRARGVAYKQLGRWEDALADFHQAVRREGTALALALRGEAHYHLGRHAQALADLEMATTRPDGDDADAQALITTLRPLVEAALR